MKRFVIEISEEAHEVLLKLQFERKMAKKSRTTIKEVASDTFNNYLESLKNKKEEPNQ